MYQLTGEESYGKQLVKALQENDVVLRRVALCDLGAIGFLPAAEAIATAPAENSFKLIALKGLLESSDRAEEALSEEAIRVMQLMDDLL
jgi:phycocyanobilin lyase alpha subunit